MKKIFVLTLLSLAIIACNKKETESKNNLKEISSLTEFNQMTSEGVSLIFFHATWCSKCAEQRPAIEALPEDTRFKDVRFGQVDYEKNTDIITQNNVIGFPTIRIYKNGIKIHELVGSKNTKDDMASKLLALL